MLSTTYRLSAIFDNAGTRPLAIGQNLLAGYLGDVTPVRYRVRTLHHLTSDCGGPPEENTYPEPYQPNLKTWEPAIVC